MNTAERKGCFELGNIGEKVNNCLNLDVTRHVSVEFLFSLLTPFVQMFKLAIEPCGEPSLLAGQLLTNANKHLTKCH